MARCFLLAMAGAALVSCGQIDAPQIFSFQFRVAPTDSTLISEVQNGTRNIAPLLTASPCVVAVSFADGVKPTVNQSGAPGDANYLITITAVNPVNFSTSSPAGCPVVTEVVLQAGGLGRNFGVGTTVDVTSLAIAFGSQRFTADSSNEHFEARLTGFAPASSFVSGDFEAIAREDGSGASMLIVSGSFAAE
ncbi:MAG: hypothetical protein AAFR35_00970 [Pseudomonadota bacterium]